ncbi:LOW QUALITY PROTEIN: cubilin [Chanos chanos]|uniref:Cubilin n=1 Tax=Chanos chanos TaxID=29144 RepID=A0A6J2UVV3_CHACN|nr:LOW QUALITY PROTEIN: cubilin [Chanos chanos]
MAQTLRLFWPFIILLFLSGLQCEQGEEAHRRSRRDVSSDQPRMISENGHLQFSAGSNKDIRFQTSGTGSVKLGNEDLTQLMGQIKINKDDIETLKNSGPSPDITNQLNELKTKVTDLETKVQTVEQTIERKTCSSNPCQNSGTCLNLLDSFHCLCPFNWQGPTCAVDVNECQIYAGTSQGCQNGATCVNTPGSYTCTCSPEWFGPHCTSRYDDCAGGSQDLCVHGLCIDSDRVNPNEPKYKCICDAGWTSPPGSAACTADVDECSLANKPCSTNPPVECFNTQGSFYCGPCPAGWQGNGYSCQDVDECATNNGGCSTSPMVSCLNTMGSFHCGQCPPGYEGDGKTCTQTDVCATNNGGCYPTATCHSVPGSTIPTCTCPPGYTGNGYGPTGCSQIIDVCSTNNPCVNGQCVNTGTGYTCNCDPGWTGNTCNQNINECASNPCQNGGTCTDGINGFTCTCTNQWTGPLCQTPQQQCGGVLTGPAGTFSYPNTPGHDQYDHLVSCAWVIRTEPDQILRITFPHFDIENSATCNFDFLQIHDGESASAFIIGRYCGSSAPAELFSSHNSLYFWFRSDSSGSAGGFTVAWTSQAPVCGGQLNDTYGNINSPGYPGNYPPSRDCYWTVNVNPGLLITFAFGTLSMEHHDDCNYDFLEIRDGLLPEDPVLGKYCSSGSPPPVHTTGPAAWIHFHSDSVISDRGFHITYTTSPADPGCGGTFTDSQGIIISPNWPNNYAHDSQCIYIIRLPRSETVYLNFTHIDLEIHSGCNFDYVEVRDGTAETAPLIGKYCGTTLPAPITSTTNGLFIRFKSDASISRAGFRAIYEIACGGTLSGMGQIRSPLFPDPYPHNKECEWVINQPEGYVVTFSFLSLDIEGSSRCIFDYVEVRDGPSASSPLIGQYCGTQVPGMLQSTQRSMYIRFKTDSSVSNHGFSAEYSSAIEGCGDTLTEPSGSFNSPGHPTSYPHGANCSWYISVPPGNIIRLSFTSFNLEFHHNCLYDYVEVYDNGTTETGTLLGRYCGRSVPPSLTSTDNMLTVLFVSDASMAVEGFSAEYVSINATTDCSEEFTTSTGELSSPNYPSNYPTNRECVYKITVGVNMQIMLNFTDFDLEGPDPSCFHDYVEVRDGGYEISPLIGRFCSHRSPPLVVSHSNRLWLKFRSDHSVTYRGFTAHWDGTQTGCGGTLTGTDGTLTSPNYPLPYHPNSECYWLIKTNPGSTLTLSFQVFHLEGTHLNNCQFDYVMVFDGDSSNARQLARLCGDELPAPITSTKNQLYIKLRTDGSVNAGGFMASYRSNCHDVVIANQSRGVIESQNYPNNYPLSTTCSWTIHASMGNTINYTFTAFELESTSIVCNYDYVELYDGLDEQATLIGKFCANVPPPANTTSGTSLHMVFHSDSSVTRPGFQMLWFQNGCGGELSGPSGSFHSPGYPNKYPENRECLWHIQTSPGSSITITIHEFNIEYHPNCNYDLLEVYGGPDLISPRLAQLCTTRPPSNPLQVSSTGNMVTVRFKSDAYVSGTGFNASWQETPGGCGGSIIAPKGEIHSPNYPGNYPDNVDCSWVITVDANHRVMFNFTDLDIESQSSCSWDYVAIHDGTSETSPLLGQVCGTTKPDPIFSTGNVIYIRFRSDNSRSHRGFSGQFSEACGSTILADDVGGAIASPNYPSQYPSNLNCSWIITAQEPFNHVTLSFTDLDLEQLNSNCSHDAVEILDGDNYQAPSIGRYCGNTLPHPITSFSNVLVVNFVTDSSVSKKGFRATYSASTSSCGGNLHMESGSFNSPNYPDAYPSNVECVWTITSSPGNRLQLSFIMFQLQESQGCTHDFLEIREGNSTGALVGRFCGNSLPSNYTSIIGHVLWIKFVSDASVSGPGFRATFSHLYGNDIIGSSGQIASPLYPRAYPNNADYRWTITVDGDSIIQIRFLDIDIEDLRDCYYDQLRIFDGPNVHAYLLGTFCGLTRPDPVMSSGSTVTLEFKSDSVIAGAGFLVEWMAIQNSGPFPTIPPGACGGALIPGETPRFLFSPGWPNEYEPDLECSWVIRSPDSIVELNVLSVDIEDDVTCSYDSLVIRDGETNLSPLLATVCGRQLPGSIHSTGDAMFLRFTSDGSINGRGFNASYSRGCGGLIHADRSVVSSPMYPQNYKPNLDCGWHVMVTPGYRITVTFQDPFQVEGFGTGCSSGDYVELRNGPDQNAPSLGGRLCGGSIPPIAQTTDNHLYVHFVSDGSNEGHGFKLLFEGHSQACGGTIELSDSDPPGYITSPNYPSNYPQNIDCVWIITVPNGEAVQLDFDSNFYIEPHTGCAYDYLELRDGSNSDAEMIAKLCGNTRPSTQHSTGSTMYLRFRTDTSVTHSGFKAKYSIAVCGGTYTGQSGTISSPGYPDSNYPDNSNCEWYLEGPTGHYLTLTFTALDLQSSTDCSSDYVEVREYNASGQLLGKHCGDSIPASVDTGDSFAYVRFVSDGSGNAGGFSLSFEASVEECGGDLSAPSGTISSPNYPNLYPHNRLCRWHITVPQGRRVTLTINDMRLEDHGNCFYDYVEVLNGFSATAPRLERFCGTVPAGHQVKSSGNTMTVIFRTDSSVSNGGFTADYSSDEEAVCGGILSDSAGGNITSPDYGFGNYSNRLNCEWLIQNPQHVNSSIVVIIDSLHLEHHQTCERDFIELRLGDSNGELLGRFCGQSEPRIPIVVFTPELWFYFRTDEADVDLGFKATYYFSDCGGYQTGEEGAISSPGYPNNYPGPSRCAWLLEAPEGHTITLTFTYFHVEEHSQCSWDSVTIFNGGSPGAPIIGQYCGTNSPGTVKSGSNKLAVVFLADHSVSRGGFTATWSTDSSGCGGIIHADFGTIKSPNYPQNFPANIECSWTIIAHQGNHLEMGFASDFDIPDASGQCQSSYIKVWSGETEQNEALLATGCGSTTPPIIIAPYNTITARFQSTGTPSKGFSAAFYTRCGANFTAPTGRVVSPNYPDHYPHNANCDYLIDAGDQTVIILTFTTFQIEAGSTCIYDGLNIYSGNTATDSPLATLCGNTIPGSFTTFGPMLLNFYSDAIINDNGFLAEYRAIPCGGVFNSTAGTVSSPTLSYSDYHHNINCTYHILVRDAHIIELKFNTFSLEVSSSCRYDYVAVYDGQDTLAPLLGKFCGRELPPTLKSSTNQLFLVFRTDASVAGVGWRATYRETLGPEQGCGGYLTSSTGMFGSPDSNWDGRYDMFLDCTWTIALPPNKVVNLTFSSFELEEISDTLCRYDHVKVFDGANMNFPLVGTFCGDVIPEPFVSSSNFLTVRFVSDGSVSLRGFNATYKAIDRLCGGDFNVTTTAQTITSPLFPNAYPPFTSCRWVLDAPYQETVKLSVKQFRLDPSQSCTHNYLEMKDWPVGDYGQSHKFCGADSHIPDFYSYGRTIHLTFKSDAFMTGNGFNLTYQVAGCSRVYEQAYGYLKSPGWPDVYPHDMDCNIVLRAPQNNSISLFFNSFNVESHQNCNYDYLEIRNGSASGTVLGKYCGPTLPNPVFPRNNELYLRFKSDFTTAYNGFEITWTSSPNGCGGVLYGDHGSFTSPDFPGTYANGTSCEWSIRAPTGRVVTVTFNQISIDDPGDCQNNYLKLYDGPDASTPPIGPYCGMETNIAPFTASSHHVFIQFRAQYAVLPSGFRLTWNS